MRNDANPVLAIEPFRLKVRRQESVVNVKNKIQLPVFHQLRDTALAGMEFKPRSHTPGINTGPPLCKHCQGQKCGSGSSPLPDQRE
jgi:hypothetical protein